MRHPDKAITKNNQDMLGRKLFINTLINLLDLYKDKESLTIWIVWKRGEWKTSAINLFKNQYKSENVLIIDFNPWYYSSSEQLIENFFNELKIAISNYSYKYKVQEVGGQVINSLLKYADVVAWGLEWIDIGIPGVANLNAGKVIANLIEKWNKYKVQDTIFTLKEKLEKQLMKLDVRIVIVVDDIDRLDTKQIIETFALVKSVASLNNLVYILSYDSEVVAKAFDLHNHWWKDYLEKIIQIPLTLPKLKSRFYADILINKLNELIEKRDLNMSEQQIASDFHHIKLGLITGYFTNLRQVNRFMNNFIVKFSAIGDEVNFLDLLFITLVEFFHEKVYYAIIQSKDFLLWEDAETWSSDWHSTEDITNNLGIEVPIKLLKTILYFFPHVKVKDRLVWSTRTNTRLSKSQRRIYSDAHFDTYFDINIYNDFLSSAEEKNIINSLKDKETFKYNLMKLIKTKKMDLFMESLHQRIDNIETDDNINYENLVSILLDIWDEINLQPASSFFFWLAKNNNIMIERIIYNAFTHIDADKRFQLLSNIIKSSKNWLNHIIMLLYKIWKSHNRYAENNTWEENLLEIEELHKLEEIFIEKIKRMKNTNIIINNEHLPQILYYWHTVTNNKSEVEKYIQSITKTIEEKITFLSKYINYESVSSDRGAKTFRAAFLKDIIDLNSFKETFMRTKNKKYQDNDAVKALMAVK